MCAYVTGKSHAYATVRLMTAAAVMLAGYKVCNCDEIMLSVALGRS